jgi:hypothetical protein
MNKLSLLLFATLLWAQPLVSQISEQVVEMSAGAQNALVLPIPGVSEELVSDLWKDYMKDFYDAKPKWQRRDDEWLSDDADILAIGKGNTVDVYAKTEEQDNEVLVYLWIDLGGAFLNRQEHPGRYAEADKLLMRFGLEAAKENIRLELEAQEDALKDLERDLARLESDKERSEREIRRAEETIEKAKEDIEQNLEEQKAMKQRIEEQRELIKEVQKRYNRL